MGTPKDRYRHFAMAESNSERPRSCGTTSEASRKTFCFGTLGRSCAQLTGANHGTNSPRTFERMPRYGMGKSIMIRGLLAAIFLSCSAPEGARVAEHLGAVKTKVNLSHRNTKDLQLEGTDPKSYTTKASLLAAIEAFTKEKQYIHAERLAYNSANQAADDIEFQVVHARTLLDLGRSPEAAKLLTKISDGAAFESDIQFLTAITHLSTIQREQYAGDKALAAFIDAARLLYQVSRASPKYTDRFPPYTSVNDVRQSLSRYGERLSLDQLNISQFSTPKAVAGVHDVLERMQRSVIAAKLLKDATTRWPKEKALWILRAKQHLTQNEPKVGLTFLAKTEPITDLNTEELLTYAAGQIAASKQLKVPSVLRLAKSYHALLTAEALKENSVFATLIPKVKETVISLLPEKIELTGQLTLTEAERASLEVLKKNARAK